MLPGQVNRPAPVYASGPAINEIEQRWRNIQATITLVDPLLADLVNVDMPRLLTIAKAAYALRTATNAESYRQAISSLNASLPT